MFIRIQIRNSSILQLAWTKAQNLLSSGWLIPVDGVQQLPSTDSDSATLRMSRLLVLNHCFDWLVDWKKSTNYQLPTVFVFIYHSFLVLTGAVVICPLPYQNSLCSKPRLCLIKPARQFAPEKCRHLNALPCFQSPHQCTLIIPIWWANFVQLQWKTKDSIRFISQQSCTSILFHPFPSQTLSIWSLGSCSNWIRFRLLVPLKAMCSRKWAVPLFSWVKLSNLKQQTFNFSASRENWMNSLINRIQ